MGINSNVGREQRRVSEANDPNARLAPQRTGRPERHISTVINFLDPASGDEGIELFPRDRTALLSRRALAEKRAEGVGVDTQLPLAPPPPEDRTGKCVATTKKGGLCPARGAYGTDFCSGHLKGMAKARGCTVDDLLGELL